MSTGHAPHARPKSSSSKQSPPTKQSLPTRHTPPPAALTPENTDQEFEPCAATGSFLLYAQRNVILVLHHDTLSIERRFELHREDVKWISVDNVSERGAGRLAVSYDTGSTAIVWDILTGHEVSRFAAYDTINVACFMRNGNIAFGNIQGTIIMFEPSTNEHVSARTIFDPITALAPAADCRSFAIGYLNGSILIATLQPAFTILHTLTTSRAPSRITGLAWHGTSSKQKTDMLATQKADGDLRVWSVTKGPAQEQPTIIRALGRSETHGAGPSWFAWSKNGRLVQYFDGETRSWDVRTKRVTYDIIPTIDGVIAVANYGPTATLFTLGRNHTVQQYDINPASVPLQVASVQHVPSNTPPTPPTILEERKNPYANAQAKASAEAPMLPQLSDAESSADESSAMSPLQKIAREMDSLDQLESELRDKVTPLSPTSSRASSNASSRSSGGRRQRAYLYDRPPSSRLSTNTGYEGTEFSFSGPLLKPTHDSMSIRSGSTRASHARFRSSSLRKEILRSPEETKQTSLMDLFPCAKARLLDVAFRTPHYGQGARTAELLQQEMLSVVFGWNDDVESLIRDEMSRHRPGSASSVLLAKWLGDMGADSMASMVGSESMTSSDWMLLALSSIGKDSQKKVGEAFVQRLLEKGDIHPAVAILLGLGQQTDAIEIYVAQGYFMEGVLLTCLFTPNDWDRTCNLLGKWAEIAVQTGEPELAVRIFSCTSVETTEPWFSPRAQDEVYTAQQRQLADSEDAPPLSSPPLSPPSRSASGRLKAKNASLKLITTFGAKGVPVHSVTDDPTPLAAGVTPIINSALSPRGEMNWPRSAIRENRGMTAPNSARTATPGGYARKKRLPSQTGIARLKQEAADIATPVTAARDFMALATRGRRTPSISDADEPTTAVRPIQQDANMLRTDSRASDRLPSPSHGAFRRLRQGSQPRNTSRERHPDGLTVQIVETKYATSVQSPGPSTRDTTESADAGYTTVSDLARAGAISPSNSGISARSAKTKAVDDYINSVEQARSQRRQERAESRARGESRSRGESRTRPPGRPERSASRLRDRSEGRGRAGVRFIKAAKKSPRSPIPMSPSEIVQAAKEAAGPEAEEFYKTAPPPSSRRIGRSAPAHKRRVSVDDLPPRVSSRSGHRQHTIDDEKLKVDDGRGRSDLRTAGAAARSPSSPLPLQPGAQDMQDPNETQSDGRRIRIRAQSSASADVEDLQTRRAASRHRLHERSTSRKPKQSHEPQAATIEESQEAEDYVPENPITFGSESQRPGRALTKKQIAARELEERRLSLARRPSAPAFPLPSDLGLGRPGMAPRSNTDLGNNPHSATPPISRSQTAEPDVQHKYGGGKSSDRPTPNASIGLPATPRAMKHPRYGWDRPDLEAPPVPMIPDGLSSLSGSLGSQLTNSNPSYSNLSQGVPSSPSQVSSSLVSNRPTNVGEDFVGPLLPSTVFGMKGPQAPARSSSAPLENSMLPPTHPAFRHGRRNSNVRNHVRKISPPEHKQTEPSGTPEPASIDQALQDRGEQQVIIIEEAPESPIRLPELQHLETPPPPPPAPTVPTFFHRLNQGGSDLTHITIDGNDSNVSGTTSGPYSDLSQAPSSFPQAMERASTASPSTHRRGHGSISESFGSRMRGVADKMRSSSRSRAKSPPMLESYTYKSPYETVLPSIPSPHMRRPSNSRARSPYEQAMADQARAMPPPPPPAPERPAPGMEGLINETSVPQRSESAKSGYRNPKDVRANMPPSFLQAGASDNPGGFL